MRQHVSNTARDLPLGRGSGKSADKTSVDDQVRANAVVARPQRAEAGAASQWLGEVTQFGGRSYLRCQRMRNRDRVSPLSAPDRTFEQEIDE